MEAKEKGVTLDAEAEAFLANVECTAPYDQPLAMATTNIFEVNHEDAYDSDVDEGPNAAAAFMANLSSTKLSSYNSDSHTEAQNVPTEVSADTSDKVSMIAILTDLQTQLDGHAKVNQEKCLEIETLKNELLQCKQEICRLDTHKVKLDLENKVRQEQALGKILSEKKDLADSYLDEIVCLKNANKVARDMLQRFNMPTQTIPMLSKKPKAATADLHKTLLGTRNPGLGYIAKRAQPVLYDADTLLHPTHAPPLELSREQAYWLPANEIASQASNPNSPVTPFVHNRPPPSQVLFHLQKVNAVFHQFEGIIKERTTQKPDYVSEWCYDYAKQFVEQQLLQVKDTTSRNLDAADQPHEGVECSSTEDGLKAEKGLLKHVMKNCQKSIATHGCIPTVQSTFHLQKEPTGSKGRTVADSIAERLTRPTAYKFKTDCSIIPVWGSFKGEEKGIVFLSGVRGEGDDE
ncbi:hypothetical protein Tco_0737281 [Tanacetum coccineum]